MHNIYIHLGFDKDVDEKDLQSMAKTEKKKKSIVLITIPLSKDEITYMQVASSTPVIDTARGKQSAYKKKPVFFK